MTFRYGRTFVVSSSVASVRIIIVATETTKQDTMRALQQMEWQTQHDLLQLSVIDFSVMVSVTKKNSLVRGRSSRRLLLDANRSRLSCCLCRNLRVGSTWIRAKRTHERG